MPRLRRVVSRRELLELVAATGALSVLSSAAHADGPAPAATIPVGDEAELIGAILWAAFAKAAKIKNIPTDVAGEGRRLSEGPIRTHLNDWGLENFPLDKTMKCARDAGAYARDQAGDGAPISAQNFRDAWTHIHDRQVAILKRLSKKQHTEEYVHVLGGAC